MDLGSKEMSIVQLAREMTQNKCKMMIDHELHQNRIQNVQSETILHKIVFDQIFIYINLNTDSEEYAQELT